MLSFRLSGIYWLIDGKKGYFYTKTPTRPNMTKLFRGGLAGIADGTNNLANFECMVFQMNFCLMDFYGFFFILL